MNPNITQPLQLEPLITPEPVSAWPAYGWWCLLLASLAAIIILVIWYRHRKRQQAPAKAAIQLLQQDLPQQPQALCLHCNQVLKRACQHYFPHVMSWHGQAWQDFLCDHGLSEHSSQALAFAVYDPNLASHINCEQLISDCLQWLKRNCRGGRHV
mgnify:CR=1 FL=1